MGFISNQWLRGTPLRRRTHDPVEIQVSLAYANDSWDHEHNIVLEIVAAISPGGAYMQMLLDSTEVESITLKLLSEEGLSVHAINALASLPDKDLIKIFTRVLAAREEGNSP